MKKLFILAIAVQICTACSTDNSKQSDALRQTCDSLQRVLIDRDRELDDIMGTFNEVQEGIQRINEAEGRVTIADGSPESASSKEVIRDNIAFIQEAMQQNRDMIAQLKEKLQRSNIGAEKLRKMVESLTKEVEQQSQRIQELEARLAEKDVQIAEQLQQIAALNTDVSSLDAENKEKARQVAAQDKELNAAWFVFGTKAELKEQRILSGGEVLSDGNFNTDYFTKIDIRYDKEIKLYSKGAKLLTNHPTDSYRLEKDSQNQYVLNITNPNKFWAASRYLVIQVK